MEERRQNNSDFQRWFQTHGFPVLVLAALAGSAYLAASVRIPAPVPDFALQAEAVYRLEVGAACFLLFYLATLALALALDIAERHLGASEQERPSALEKNRLR